MLGPRGDWQSLTPATQYSLFGDWYWQVSQFLQQEFSFTVKWTLILCLATDC